MRVLVTGGSGFVGSHIVETLATGGHEVRVLARDPDRLMRSLAPHGPMSVDVARGDLTDAGAVEAAVDGCSAVIHAANVFTFDLATEPRCFGPTSMGRRSCCRRHGAPGATRSSTCPPRWCCIHRMGRYPPTLRSRLAREPIQLPARRSPGHPDGGRPVGGAGPRRPAHAGCRSSSGDDERSVRGVAGHLPRPADAHRATAAPRGAHAEMGGGGHRSGGRRSAAAHPRTAAVQL